MEDVLWLYNLPYDRDYPQVCFDERPCVLHGEVVEPLSMQPGKPLPEDYEYERKGTCCLLVAFEPKTGFRLVEVSKQRTAADYTRFMKKLAAHYPEAKRIRLVQDNLKARTRRLPSIRNCRRQKLSRSRSASNSTTRRRRPRG